MLFQAFSFHRWNIDNSRLEEIRLIDASSLTWEEPIKDNNEIKESDDRDIEPNIFPSEKSLLL